MGLNIVRTTSCLTYLLSVVPLSRNMFVSNSLFFIVTVPPLFGLLVVLSLLVRLLLLLHLYCNRFCVSRGLVIGV